MKKKLVIPAEQVWQVQKPRYNAWQTGHGVHQSKKKYNRQRAKAALRKEISNG